MKVSSSISIIIVACMVNAVFSFSSHVTNATIAGTEPWLNTDERTAALHDKDSLYKKCRYTTDIVANR